MLLESLSQTKVPCEVLIPQPGPNVAPNSRSKVGELGSMDGGALQPPPPPLLAAKEATGGGGMTSTPSAFVAPGAPRRSGGGGGGSFDGRVVGSTGAEGLRLGVGGLLRKSSALAGRSLIDNARGVDNGSPREGGDGLNSSRMPSSSTSSSSSACSSPPSSLQTVVGGGGGRLVDARSGGASIKQQGWVGGIPPGHRTIGQAFRPGELECECRYSRRFPLYHRLQANVVLGTLASSTLEGRRVRGRSGLYVCPDKEGNVFYMTLMEVRQIPE